MLWVLDSVNIHVVVFETKSVRVGVIFSETVSVDVMVFGVSQYRCYGLGGQSMIWLLGVGFNVMMCVVFAFISIDVMVFGSVQRGATTRSPRSINVYRDV